MSIQRLFLLLLCCLVRFDSSSNVVLADERPNIILVFIDDMGWADFSCFGNKSVETPNIDLLAKEGIRFEQFYVNSPICSPSRVAISTGQYPQRWKITSYLAHRRQNTARGMAQWLDPAAPVLARLLQQGGYATGHFGKWHMGGQRDVADAPLITEYGFEESLTNFEGMGPKLLPLVQKPGQDQPRKIWGDAERLGKGFQWMLRSKITGGFVDAAKAFIDKAQSEGRPFYINVWPDDVHSPFWPDVGKWPEPESKKALYDQVLVEMDRQLGSLFQHIRGQPALKRNTLILVCSDNGPEKGAGSAGRFRGYKTQLYEGGIRSPLVAWGPEILERQALVDRHSFFSAIDLPPTLLRLTGVNVPSNIAFDGQIMLAALKGQGGSRSDPLFFRRPPDRDSFYGDPDLPDLAVRQGNWKLLCEYDGSQPQLYNLASDPAESINLTDQHADLTRELKERLLTWHLSMPADLGAEWRPKGAK